jgi:hypothetical protein
MREMMLAPKVRLKRYNDGSVTISYYDKDGVYRRMNWTAEHVEKILWVLEPGKLKWNGSWWRVQHEKKKAAEMPMPLPEL